MDKIRSVVEQRIEEIGKDIKKIEEFLQDELEGTLNYKIVNERVYFYQQFTSNINANTSKNKRNIKQKYIKKKEIGTAKKLAQKAYYLVTKPILEKQYKKLSMFLDDYKPEELQKVYDELNDIRKGIVTPIAISKEEIIKQWNEEVYIENDYYKENKKYETNQGEVVRSKSEVIIANLLYQYRKDILYKYERPLDILVNGVVNTVYPDFTILNIHTGKIVYLEHAGCMDNPSYANDFVKKINNYVLNDIIPGVNLITTYESRECPLDIKVVRNMIEDVLYKL